MNLNQEKKGFCIQCGVKIQWNPKNPYCAICGTACNACNRFSGTDNIAMYCHMCGEPVYVEEKNPICDECQKELTN
ncbi:hypothetical protein [Candidatus Harpocratesius sp.]